MSPQTGILKWKIAGGLLTIALCASPFALAQEDRDRDHDRDHDRMTRLEPGTVIPVRNNDWINVERRDNRVYYGTVDQDVRGENGRLAIPRGSQVEMIVRVAPDNDLILDLESVTVNGERYAIRANPDRMEAQRDNSLVGNIIGAVTGAQVRGQVVKVPKDAVLRFRLDRPLEMGVADRGEMRNGEHYHDWYNEDRDH